MEGGKKGLFVNSRNICAAKNRANADMVAQSERKSSETTPHSEVSQAGQQEWAQSVGPPG
jgi:hypothetical protein